MPAPPLQITKWEVSCCPCSHLWWPVPGFCSEGCLEPALGHKHSSEGAAAMGADLSHCPDKGGHWAVRAWEGDSWP